MASRGTWSGTAHPCELGLDDFDCYAGSWYESFDLDAAQSIVRRFPGRSVWVQSARECVIVGDWRRRPEVASVAGMHGVRYRRELLASAAQQAASLGLEGIVVVEWSETATESFYASAGFQLLNAVVPLELDRRRFPQPGVQSLPVQQLDVRTVEVLEQLVRLDHAAFDWLWINGREEFVHYGRAPEVEIWGQYVQSQLVSYLGITSYAAWGHIDRLAVHPEWQGRGLGNELTRFAVNRLANRGCSSVGLSTQLDNWRSQRLYGKLGFRRSDANTYRIYGQIFLNR